MRKVRFRDDSGVSRLGEWNDGVIEYFGERIDAADVDVLPPMEPTKVILVGRNLQDSIDELGVDPPNAPRLFFVPPGAVVGPESTVKLPSQTGTVVFGAELGVVIGRQCRNVPAEEAMDVVEGFTCVNDLSNVGDEAIDPGKARVKGFDGAKPIGPVLAGPEHVPGDATIGLRVNGDLVQQSSRSEFLFTVPEIVEETSSYFTLERGDVISMGSPSGNAAVDHGDTVEVNIEGIGTLRHGVERTPDS